MMTIEHRSVMLIMGNLVKNAVHLVLTVTTVHIKQALRPCIAL
jgi:hypothetical protein